MERFASLKTRHTKIHEKSTYENIQGFVKVKSFKNKLALDKLSIFQEYLTLKQIRNCQKILDRIWKRDGPKMHKTRSAFPLQKHVNLKRGKPRFEKSSEKKSSKRRSHI